MWDVSKVRITQDYYTQDYSMITSSTIPCANNPLKVAEKSAADFSCNDGCRVRVDRFSDVCELDNGWDFLAFSTSFKNESWMMKSYESEFFRLSCC